MHRLGLNQVLLWTCATRRKSRKSELVTLFVKGTPFHVPKLVGVRSIGAAPGGVFAQRPSGAHDEGEYSGCPCLNPGSGLLWPNSLLYR